MNHTKNKSGSPRFQVGDKVRVVQGFHDPILTETNLGGWSGTIKEIEQFEDEITYQIEWDNRTLDGMHPTYWKSCERDGLETETMWLDEEYIEPDDGTPVPIEQPTGIKTPPLSMDDQDDRIRAVFGLTHDDLLPEVNRKNQFPYYSYLLAHLTLPFRAQYRRMTGPNSSKLVRLTVTGLYDFDQYEVEECHGLIGVGKEPGGSVELSLREIEGIEDQANRRLIEDYAFWLVNYG